jgi:hypothetical protein
MGQNRRRAPAIFPRDGTRGEPPRPQFISVGPPVQVVAASNPVIPFIRGQWFGDRVQWLGEVVPRYQRFPYFDQSQQPGIPFIPFRVTRTAPLESRREPGPAFYRLVTAPSVVSVVPLIPFVTVRFPVQGATRMARPMSSCFLPFSQAVAAPQPSKRLSLVGRWK